MRYKTKKAPVLSEHDEQRNLVHWFRLQYPHLARCFFAIPNGGHRNILVAKKMKDEGVMRGVADLFLMLPRNGCHGLFIEMKKSSGGHQSEEQKEFQKTCLLTGYKYFLARGCKDAMDFLKEYLAE